MIATTQEQVSAPPSAQVLGMAFGYVLARSVHVAAKLGIADLLKDGPQKVAALAAATETHAGALYRVLRALAANGIFVETEPHTFGLTPLAETLRSDVPGSIRPMVLFVGDDMHWAVYGKFAESVRTGKTGMELAFGLPAFEYINLHPEDAKVFNDAMRSHSAMAIPAIIEAYDFGQFGIIADIAGGQGHLLAAILDRYPKAQGILFDLPQAIEHARSVALLNGNARLIGGSFFESVPEGADAYMLKHIIHDWDDAAAQKILESCRRAMSADGKLLIIEMILPEMNEPGFAKILDLEMLAIPGGKERTTEEYAALLAAAGFKLTRVVPTRSPVSILEAVPA